MFDTHLITREIDIDMGHRVTYHGSKCRNLHGHRYTIQVVMQGPLAKGGEQDGMVMDFGFLKDVMMDQIDTPCDHGLCLWIEDPLLDDLKGWRTKDRDGEEVDTFGYALTEWSGGKLYLLHCVPTAENLARHWFERMTHATGNDPRNTAGARVMAVKVWETPNCMAEYAPYRME